MPMTCKLSLESLCIKTQSETKLKNEYYNALSISILTCYCKNLRHLRLEKVVVSGCWNQMMTGKKNGMPCLRQFEVVSCSLTTFNAHFICEALSGIHRLEKLNLGSNNIRCDSVDYLCKTLVKLPLLRSLHLDNNKIGYYGIQSICNVLPSLTALKFLDVTNNIRFNCKTPLPGAAHCQKQLKVLQGLRVWASNEQREISQSKEVYGI
jgi:Leucine-rich repeat (LRR) protein